jgi:arsenate reductase
VSKDIILYGIRNCDTVKKALRWLDEHGVAYTFHDFKKAGVPEDGLDRWIAAVGWQKLVNRQGTTWRKLGPEVQAGVTDAASARRLMLEQPSVIKRPVVEAAGQVLVGFDEAAYQALAAG